MKRMQENEQLRRDSATRPRLRSSEPDLRIIVGSNENGGIKEFLHYSSILAYESGYVDTLLSTRVGEPNGRIAFPDITPSQWKQMMKILRESHECKNLDVEVVCELATLYDKYDFKRGLNCCDAFLENYIPDNSTESITDFDKLDEYIDIILFGQKLNLKRTFSRAKSWLSDMFEYALQPPDLGVATDLFLKESQIKKLAPVLKTMETDISELLGYNVDVSNPLFFRLVCLEAAAKGREARQEISRVRVSFYRRDHPAAGVYEHDITSSGEIIRYQLREKGEWKPYELRRSNNCMGFWELFHDDEAFCRCNTGDCQFLQIPPHEESKWIYLYIDEDHDGPPRVSYYL